MLLTVVCCTLHNQKNKCLISNLAQQLFLAFRISLTNHPKQMSDANFLTPTKNEPACVTS